MGWGRRLTEKFSWLGGFVWLLVKGIGEKGGPRGVDEHELVAHIRFLFLYALILFLWIRRLRRRGVGFEDVGYVRTCVMFG